MPERSAPGLVQSYTRNLPHCPELIRKFLEIQSLCKIHENIHTKAEWIILACVTHSRRTWSQAAMSDYKKYPTRNVIMDRVAGLTGDLGRYCWRQVYELSVHVSRSHSGVSARWNWNKFCYAVVSMRSSAQEEDNIIEHAQCCPGKDIKKYSPLFRLMVKLSFTLRAAIDSRS